MRARRDSNPSPELRRPLCYPSYTTSPNENRKGICRGQILPGDPVPPVEREEANEEFPFSVLLCELGVSAASAGDTVLVDGQECSGSAFGAELLGPCDGVAVDLVCAGFLNSGLGCACFCHLNHSSAAGASGAFASMPFLLSRYSLSNSSAASLDA